MKARLILRILFSMVIALLCSASYAGNGKKDTYQVYVNAHDESIRASVLAEPAKEKTDIERTYYWYAANKILNTKGGYEGKLLHGEYVSFYLDNNLKEKGNFKRGLKHGKWVSWYTNGKIKDITEWTNGKRNGIYKSFNELGQPVLEARFSDDLLTGKLVSYENGKILSTKRYKKGEEIVPKPKKVKEKKTDAPADSIKKQSKEGINTVTPTGKKQEVSLKERWHSLFAPKSKTKKDEAKDHQQEKETKKEKVKQEPSKEKDSTGKTSTKKPKEKKTKEKEQDSSLKEPAK